MSSAAQEPSAGWFDGREHRLPVRVYYEDTDFTGLVYHASYARFLERGRSDFLRLAGVRHAALLDADDPIAFAVTRLALEFRKAARIDDALIVHTAYDAARGPRLAIAQSVSRDGELLVAAQVEAACVGLDGRARRPPAALIARLTPYFDRPAPAPP